MFRRVVFAACTVFSAWILVMAAPAGAQTYGGVLGGNNTNNPPAVIGGNDTLKGVNGDTGVEANEDLARTGSDNAVPLVEAGIVLVGGGALLALVARRRRAERRAVTA